MQDSNENIPFAELLAKTDPNPVEERVVEEPDEIAQDVPQVQERVPDMPAQQVEIKEARTPVVELLKSRSKGQKRRLPTRKPRQNLDNQVAVEERPAQVLEQRPQVNNVANPVQHAIQSSVIVFDYKAKNVQDFNAKFAPLTNANYKSNFNVLPTDVSSINGIWVKTQQNLPSMNTVMPFAEKMKLHSVEILPANNPEPVQQQQVADALINKDKTKSEATTPKKISFFRRILACLQRFFSRCFSGRKLPSQ